MRYFNTLAILVIVTSFVNNKIDDNITPSKINELKRTIISLQGGVDWEEGYGFSRAKVVDSSLTSMKEVVISNTSAWDETGEIQSKDNVLIQVEQIIMNIKKAMQRTGGSLNDIIEKTIYVTDYSCFQEIAKVHKKYFGDVRSATTLIQITGMASEDMLVEGSARPIISK